MRRLASLLAASMLAGTIAVAFVAGADAAPPTSIVGTWAGRLTPPAGSRTPRQSFTITIKRGERSGTWRVSARCGGTLRLKDISNGYHHYYRLGARAGCAPTGIDCLQRSGAKMVDVFVPTSGAAVNGTFRRIG